jgi:type II secretory pathway component PulM
MSIVDSAKAAWNERSERERLLLVALAFLLGALTFWYGLAAPLRSNAERASDELRRTLEIESTVRAAGARNFPAAVAVDQVLETMALVGMVPKHHDVGDAGAITISASARDSASLFEWIRELETRLGVAVANLTVTRNSEGTLDVEAVLAGG